MDVLVEQAVRRHVVKSKDHVHRFCIAGQVRQRCFHARHGRLADLDRVIFIADFTEFLQILMNMRAVFVLTDTT